MCVQTIYHNTFGDGRTSITTRTDSCVPGYVCPHPAVQHVNRTYTSSRPAGLTPFYPNDPPTPRSLSPPGSRGSHSGGSGDERERKHHLKSSTVYLNGVKVSESRRRPAAERAERDSRSPVTFQRRSSTRVPYAPEPPAARPIPIMHRSSTMPTGMETPPTRGRRPIIVEERAPRQPATTTTLPAEIVEHASSPSAAARLQRRSSRAATSGDYLTPHVTRRDSTTTGRGSPTGYTSAEDERERRERHRRRREARHQASAMAASAPTFGTTDIYSSSLSSNASSNSRDPVSPSAAVREVKKELRWEDQIRAQQNARISGRPKLPRSATLDTDATGLPASAAQAEVKSILKNGGSHVPVQAAAEPASPSRRRESRRSPAVSDDERDLDGLRRSVAGLGLQGMSPGTSPSRRRERESAAWAAATETNEDRGQMDRLRNRFSMPPRRYTAGQGTRQRSEIWYPDEGTYKYY